LLDSLNSIIGVRLGILNIDYQFYLFEISRLKYFLLMIIINIIGYLGNIGILIGLSFDELLIRIIFFLICFYSIDILYWWRF